MKPTVLGTGLSGLVGSRLVDLLQDRYDFVNLDLSNGVDILDPHSIAAVVDQHPATVMLHLAAFTDLNQAQQEAGSLTGPTYRVNVDGTENIARICAERGMHLIHFSTSYVFNGHKKTPYVETDEVHPIDWYSQTKVWAEEAVINIIPTATILRIAYPYRQDEFAKKDIWHKIADSLQAGQTGPFFSDHYFTLTPVEWLSEVVAWAINAQPRGIFHATTDQVYTDYTLAQEIQRHLELSGPLQKSSVVEYNRHAARPYAPYLVLDNSKLQAARHQ